MATAELAGLETSNRHHPNVLPEDDRQDGESRLSV
jgi:hypothetical protein